MGSCSLLQGDLLTQELNQGLLHCRQILHQLNYQGSPSSSPEKFKHVSVYTHTHTHSSICPTSCAPMATPSMPSWSFPEAEALIESLTFTASAQPPFGKEATGAPTPGLHQNPRALVPSCSRRPRGCSTPKAHETEGEG